MKPQQKLRQQLLALLQGADYQPSNKSELSRALGIAPKQRKSLRNLLATLESEGAIRQVRKGRYIPRLDNAGDESTGVIRFRPRGDAWVFPGRKSAEIGRAGDDRNDGRVFVPARNTSVALDGDIVGIKIQKASPQKWQRHIRNAGVRERLAARNENRREGRVVQIVKRKTESVVGTFRKKGKFAYVQPDSPLLPPTLELDLALHPLPDPPPNPGDKVVAKMESWASRNVPPRGHITRVLGPPSAPGVDILTIIHRHGLPLEFPDEVTAEAERISETVLEKELENREDWRDRPVFTIDPVDARDFDDAILVTPQKDGGWELAVHIADVSHYVKGGTALDLEARLRGNSVYLVDRVIPMLPERLSNGVCSLKPDVERLTRASIMRFDKHGNMKDVRFTPAVIRSQCRLTYEEAIIKMKLSPEAAKKDPAAQRLHEAWDLASALRKNRFKDGALDLDFPEIKIILDKRGRPVELRRIEYDESHQLIEEFMLAANEAVARATRDALKPSVYRIHEDPDADKLFEFRELAISHGFTVGDLSQRAELQKLLKMVRGEREEHAIKIGLLKSLKRAAYSADPIGHYGLAKTNYTHFTSPIRRYSDLVVHRVLNRLTGHSNEDTPSQKTLVEMAEHLSTTERTAANAEIESQRLKQLEYFDQLATENPEDPPTFKALVHDVRRTGLLVELTDYYIKGLVKVEDFPFRREGWRYEGQFMRFTGYPPKTTLELADELTVQVARVDFEKQWIDFKIVEQ